MTVKLEIFHSNIDADVDFDISITVLFYTEHVEYDTNVIIGYKNQITL